MSILDWIKLLNVLSESEKEKLSLFGQEKYIESWEILFNEQDEASAMYILKKWNIQINLDLFCFFKSKEIFSCLKKIKFC